MSCFFWCLQNGKENNESIMKTMKEEIKFIVVMRFLSIAKVYLQVDQIERIVVTFIIYDNREG